MNEKVGKILKCLKENTYITTKDLAFQTGMGQKMVRNRIGELQEEAKRNGARILCVQNKGIYLEVLNRELYDEWLTDGLGKNFQCPSTSYERCQYILSLFLLQDRYIKIEELQDSLFVSPKTVSSEIKKVEYILEQYNLSIERRPGYGMRLTGLEFDIRQCLLGVYIAEENQNKYLPWDESLSERLANILLSVMKEGSVQFSDIAFHNVVLYLMIMCIRCKDGHYTNTNEDEIARVSFTEEYHVAKQLLKSLEEAKIINTVTDSECFFVCVYIMGKRVLNGKYPVFSNFVISDEIDRLVLQMLTRIYETYGIDFRSDFNLRMMFDYHMVSFDIRMKYNIYQENPLLDVIKKKYPFAYAIAQCSSVVLKEYYKKTIPEVEIGFFAEFIEMGMKTFKKEYVQKNILLVCSAGRVSSRLLQMRFQEEFGKYINHLETCNYYELANKELKDIDYVFSTIPIHYDLGVPIFEISNFLERDEIAQIYKKFELGNPNFMNEYFHRELFFCDIDGNTYEEVLKEMCERMAKTYYLPDGFLESVMEREMLGGTDYGNQVALPHPQQILLPYNVACVAILKKPILWSKNQVQMVLLVSVGDSLSEKTQKFFKVTSDFISNEKAVQWAIESKDFDVFMSLLME